MSGFAVLVVCALAEAAPIRVAVEQAATSTGTGTDLVAQLEDDTWFDLEATLVTADQIDSAAELAAFDVVILGHPGSGAVDYTAVMADALEGWVELGLGGVIGNAWLDYGLQSGTVVDIGEPLDAVLPIDAWPGGYQFCSTPQLEIEPVSHPVTSGLGDFVVGSAHVEYSPDPPDASNAEVLATAIGGSCSSSVDRNAVVVGEHGAGRIAWLGLQYGAAPSYAPEGLRTGPADRLLEQAVAWVAPSGLDDADGDGDPDIRDCDDADPAVYTGAIELCNGVDDDCSGVVDDLASWYADADGDGYGDPAVMTGGCTIPTGFVANDDDCDDADAAVHPGATEHCDEVDEDCDGVFDEGAVDPPPWYGDVDSDGYGDPTLVAYGCTAPSGYVAEGTDCDDAHAPVHPGATEQCNDVDDDCDGAVDEGTRSDYWPDGDADGYGLSGESVRGCAPPNGYAAFFGDCDDADPHVNPDAIEACNSTDDDCDGAVDEHTLCSDDDGDGWSELDGDCHDGDRAIHPDGTEVPDNERDDDCDGLVDERDEVAPPAEVSGSGCSGCAGGRSAGLGLLPLLVALRRRRRAG